MVSIIFLKVIIFILMFFKFIIIEIYKSCIKKIYSYVIIYILIHKEMPICVYYLSLCEYFTKICINFFQRNTRTCRTARFATSEPGDTLGKNQEQKEEEASFGRFLLDSIQFELSTAAIGPDRKGNCSAPVLRSARHRERGSSSRAGSLADYCYSGRPCYSGFARIG